MQEGDCVNVLLNIQGFLTKTSFLLCFLTSELQNLCSLEFHKADAVHPLWSFYRLAKIHFGYKLMRPLQGKDNRHFALQCKLIDAWRLLISNGKLLKMPRT